MRNGLSIQFNDVAAFLAHEDANVQASFFSTFTKELRAVCGTFHHSSIQMCFVLKSISDQDKETLWMDNSKMEDTSNGL